MFEYHFKHEIMEHQLVRKKNAILSPQALLSKLKLVMGLENPNYKLTLEDSPTHGEQRNNTFAFSPSGGRNADRPEPKMNFWGEVVEQSLGHSYSTREDLAEARNDLKRWYEELKEKRD